MITERECINLILQHVGTQHRDYLVKGIGDDCAVLATGGEKCLLLTTDTLVEGVHFDLAWHPPYLLGRKSASVNLSDIGAMGGQPLACLLSIGFPGSVPSWLDDFMKGFLAVLQEHDTLLVGGDTVKGRNDLVISVTIIGEAEQERICYRSGAQPGDMIWISGPLGHAAAGLDLCRSGFARYGKTPGKWQQFIKAHLDPQPQVAVGKVLGASGLVHAMMDISDGLATDLAHLCKESGVGAEVEQALLPVSEPLQKAAAELDAALLDWILRGGEDYQLLFAAKAGDEQKLRQHVLAETGREIFHIGRIVKGQSVYLCKEGTRREISYQGYDHFAD